ncbi:N-acetyltransferase [Schaedlerella arabinosiphila]|uniref:N-acetyltransferase n=1 Tax=Schaedlerella arabinosiphila TaxID=2044587 RepID=A0A426DPX2_9FIRM|nr:GNAT family N-acetyltransferase [Schaedlerella arabinosiphila]RRK34682.1 N-acetyltransferase [Schaedlerella arabinosiphila]
MVYDDVLKGRYVDLRAVSVEDAEFTLKIRQNPKNTRGIPKLNNTIEEQQEWIRNQRKKEGDYFFLVVSKSGEKLGTTSIYNIEGDVGEGGRLILNGDAFQIFEASLLLNRFAFDNLGLNKIVGFTFASNKRAIRFNRKMGYVICEPEKDEKGIEICRCCLTKERNKETLSSLERILY